MDRLKEALRKKLREIETKTERKRWRDLEKAHKER
jgi:hypothetical protein